jgi:hypothetical protein
MTIALELEYFKRIGSATAGIRVVRFTLTIGTKTAAALKNVFSIKLA